MNLGVAEHLLNRFKSTPEEFLAELFETDTREGSVEINTLEGRVDFDGCLGSRRKGTLSLLADTMNSTRI